MNPHSKKKSPSREASHTCDLLVTGTGSLAESTLLTWPQVAGPGSRIRVTILSRSEEKARALAVLANLRAAALDCELDCTSASTNWEEPDLRRHIAACRPRVILHAASLQSPWAKGDTDSPWRQTMRGLGFGVSTALQAVLAFRVGRAARAAAPNAAFVNCCYPDAVNPLLAAAGIPITCGVGNVAIVTAVWHSRLRSTQPVRVLAHHAHLTHLVRPDPAQKVLPRVWIGDAECDHVGEVLANVDFPKGQAMNHLTGAVTATLVQALLGGRPVRSHAPGPGGLVGGYPVVARAGKVTLDLPRGLTRSQAVAFNEQAQIAEGIASIGKRGLRYTDSLATELRRCGSKFPDGFGPREVEQAAHDLMSVRERMGGVAP